MAINKVESLHRSSSDIAEYLRTNAQISFLTDAEDNFRKILILAAASYFETLITDCIRKFVEEELPERHPLFKIVKTKGIDFQYHKWFDWKERNGKSFFKMFGDGFRDFMRAKLADDPHLESSISAFLELGELRNHMVHENFANFTIEKTFAEIYGLYKEATTFAYSIYGFLAEYRRSL